jgi:hypothetical protein
VASVNTIPRAAIMIKELAIEIRPQALAYQAVHTFDGPTKSTITIGGRKQDSIDFVLIAAQAEQACEGVGT